MNMRRPRFTHVIYFVCSLLATLLLHVPSARAAITVISATPTSATVEPGEIISATVQTTLTNGTNWRSTEWRISATNAGAFNCIDTNNNNTNGTYTHSINVTAPTVAGAYYLYVRSDTNNNCTGTNSNTYVAGTVIIPLTSVVSIDRADASPTPAGSVSWTVTFNRVVTGVTAGDFALVNNGLGGTPAIISVTGSGTTYTVTASTGTGSGTLGLNLVDNDSIVGAYTNRLGGTGTGNGNFTGQVYTIDRTAPALSTANSICGLSQVMVSFSETLDTASAQTATNYSLSGGATVTSAMLLPDGKTVLLQTSAMNAGSYTLTVSNVKDLAGNSVAVGSQANFTFTGGTLTQGISGLYYGQNGAQGAYFTGTPIQRIDSTIDFNWVNGSPMPGIGADDFSVRWSGYVLPPLDGSYQLQTASDDGVRLYLNGQTLIDNWTPHALTYNTSAAISLNSSVYYPIQMDFYERGGQAEAHLLGSYSGGPFSVVASNYLYYCSVPVTATPGAFNAFEPTTPTNSISGAIKTKVAGTDFNLDLIALNPAKDAVLTNFTGDVKVELLNNTGASTAIDGISKCPLSFTTLSTATATFATTDSGRKANVSFSAVANVWQDVRVRISYPATGTATVVACSNDNFAIRPAKLDSIAATDANWSAAGNVRALSNSAPSGGNVHKAGQPFMIAATAYNAVGGVTSNYQGAPKYTTNQCKGDLGAASSCTASASALSIGSWSPAASPANGTVVTSNASYPEVGTFYLQLWDEDFAVVDSGDSSAAERYVPLSAKTVVGRFVPDHFVVGSNTAGQFKTFNDATCASRSFTYIGQSFGYTVLPVALVTAVNAAGATTTNYQGNLWKITASDVTQTYGSTSATLGTPQIGTPDILPLNNGTGTVTVNSSDKLTFARNTTTPQSPFNANITLTLSVVDTKESSGVINTTSPVVFGSGSGIAFDAGNEFRYGILKLSNAHGSELLKLPVALETQYWNGTRFVTNTADNCSRFDGANVTLNNYQKNLTACETDVPPSGRLFNGKGSFVLAAPGAGNNGSVDLRINLSTALGSACVPNKTGTTAVSAQRDYLAVKKAGGTYTGDPSGKAAFGIRNSGPVIYMREIY